MGIALLLTHTLDQRLSGSPVASITPRTT